MSEFTIGKKIGLACGTLLAFTLALGGVGLVNVTRMTEKAQEIVDDSLPGSHKSGQLESKARDLRLLTVAHIALTDVNDKNKLREKIMAGRGSFLAMLKDYERTIHREEDRQIYASIAPAFEKWTEVNDRILALSQELKQQEAMVLRDTACPAAFAVLDQGLGKLSEYNRLNGERSAGEIMQAAATAKSWSIILLSIAFVAGAGLWFVIGRSIVKTLSAVAIEMAECAGQVSSGAEQVAAGSQSLAQGATEQAAAIEETSASTEEMSSMTRKNADTAQNADKIVENVNEHVAAANRSLEQMMESMNEITSSSGKISRILKVIDDIAFQTNILALNAAVEAARAGEAGSGFAVVADEVRNLAQRCAVAAKDTAQLIDESIRRSTEGKLKLEGVASAIQSITGSSEELQGLVAEVSVSSQEQSRGIEQIAKAVHQMEHVTQSSAATAEESAASAEELSAMAKSMRNAVQKLESMAGLHVTAA
jgi:methyl-accepting chemotaxis protein